MKRNPDTHYKRHNGLVWRCVDVTLWLPDRTLSGNAGGISVFAGGGEYSKKTNDTGGVTRLTLIDKLDFIGG